MNRHPSLRLLSFFIIVLFSTGMALATDIQCPKTGNELRLQKGVLSQDGYRWYFSAQALPEPLAYVKVDSTDSTRYRVDIQRYLHASHDTVYCRGYGVLNGKETNFTYQLIDFPSNHCTASFNDSVIAPPFGNGSDIVGRTPVLPSFSCVP